MQIVSDAAHAARNPSEPALTPLWMADGPPVCTTIDGEHFPFVTPVRDGWSHLLLPVRRSYRAQLEIEQAHVVLCHLLPGVDSVGLAFWPDLAGKRASAFTQDRRDGDGVVDPHDPGLVTVRDDRYLVDTFTGNGADLLLRLDDGAGGFEWPGLIWNRDRTWVMDSGPGRAFSLLSAPPRICEEIASDPRSGGVSSL